MDKKASIGLAVIRKVYDKFQETRTLIEVYSQECCKENFFVVNYSY